MTQEEALPLVVDVLQMPGWTEVMQPGLMRARDQAILSLINGATDKKFTDDYTKGQINALSWMIAWPQRIQAATSELVGAQVQPEPEPVGTVLGPDGEATSPSQS